MWRVGNEQERDRADSEQRGEDAHDLQAQTELLHRFFNGAPR